MVITVDVQPKLQRRGRKSTSGRDKERKNQSILSKQCGKWNKQRFPHMLVLLREIKPLAMSANRKCITPMTRSSHLAIILGLIGLCWGPSLLPVYFPLWLLNCRLFPVYLSSGFQRAHTFARRWVSKKVVIFFSQAVSALPKSILRNRVLHFCSVPCPRRKQWERLPVLHHPHFCIFLSCLFVSSIGIS